MIRLNNQHRQVYHLNSSGACVYLDDIAKDQTRSDISLDRYFSGMYMAIIKNGNITITRKIILQ